MSRLCQDSRAGVSRSSFRELGAEFRWYVYRVTHLVANLGWVDFDLGCSTILLCSRYREV